MKNLLIVILLTVSMQCFADISAICITPVEAKAQEVNANGVVISPKVDAHYHLSIYGLKENGETTEVDLTTDDDMQKFKDLELSSLIGHAEGSIRTWIYFTPEGAVDRVDVQSKGKFSSKIKYSNELDHKTETNLAEFKEVVITKTP